MVAAGEDELICDFAETYHVLNWRGLPPRLAAILAGGLPDSSRVKRRQRGETVPADTLLLAAIADAAALLLWRHAKEGTPKPPSLVETLTGRTEAEKRILVFRDGRAFDAALARFVETSSVTAAGGGDSKLGMSHASRASECFPRGEAEKAGGPPRASAPTEKRTAGGDLDGR